MARTNETEKRVRLRAIWQPIAVDLIDTSFSRTGADDGRLMADPTFIGVTCDTRRPVFLEKEVSAGGFVYRKFRVRYPRSAI
jgi:hypothetical protein